MDKKTEMMDMIESRFGLGVNRKRIRRESEENQKRIGRESEENQERNAMGERKRNVCFHSREREREREL